LNVAIFGATGRTGQALAQVALAHGDDVRALVRGRSNPWIARARDRLTIVHGDPKSDATIAQMIEGVSVVFCVFGPRSTRQRPFRAALTRRILRAMAAAGVHRIVCITGAMVGRMPHNTSFAMRAMRAMFERTHRSIADDGAGQEAAIVASETQWTIVKPPRLTDERRTGVVHAGPTIPIGLMSSIGRRDLAEFVHRVATQDRYVRQRVYVRN
jgi:putative NADH-flavin reductase